MTVKAYAQALDALFQKEPHHDLGSRFATMLREKGKSALLPLVISECERLESKRKALQTLDVIVVSSHHVNGAIAEAKDLIQKRGGDPELWTIRVIEDPHLIGGYMIRTTNTLFDASDRSALYRLYERLKG